VPTEWVVDSYTMCGAFYHDFLLYRPPAAWGLDSAAYTGRLTWGMNAYEKFIRKYAITGKPLIAAVWTSAERRAD